MSKLLMKPASAVGKIHDISAKKAGWGYVGFSLYLLEEGQLIKQETFDEEVILVLVEGHAEIVADGKKFGILGDRLDVFEKSPPHCVMCPVKLIGLSILLHNVHLLFAQHLVRKNTKLLRSAPPELS